MLDLKNNFEFGDAKIINFLNLTNEEKEMIRIWRNDENIRIFMFSDHLITFDEHGSFIKKLGDDSNNFYWLVKKNDEYVGIISLNRIDFTNRNAYLGLYANPDNKVSGAGQILIGCLKKLAFSIANLHSMKLEVLNSNKRAINFFEKSGFNNEGRLKDFVIKRGEWQDVIVMGILNGDKV
jgi:UDP-4-amino-4,6-dideoxy-N-acetyl-beta-L-altrosamine N-acetyltransferase